MPKRDFKMGMWMKKRNPNINHDKIIADKKKKLKNAVKVLIVIFVVLSAVCLLLFGFYQILKSSRLKNQAQADKSDKDNASSDFYYVNYYEPDYEADIFTEEEYMSKDRTKRYIKGNISIVLDEYSKASLDQGQKFFVEYFDAIISGDYCAYNSMIAQDYKGKPHIYGENPRLKKFPMQRIYDIKIKELGKTDFTDESFIYDSKPAVFSFYEVCYKIQKNDGEFRINLPSDSEIPVIYELVTIYPETENEKTMLLDAYLYTDIKDEKNE